MGGVAGGSVGLPAQGSAPCRPQITGSTFVTVVVRIESNTPTQRCVELSGRVTGFDALLAAGHTLRIEGGFLCAIDGVPATGCAQSSGFDGTYWRYFIAGNDGVWNYSSVGAGRRLSSGCVVEGWVYSNVSGAGQPPVDPAPRTQCSVAATTTVPPVTTTRPSPQTSVPQQPGMTVPPSGGAQLGGATPALPPNGQPAQPDRTGNTWPTAHTGEESTKDSSDQPIEGGPSDTADEGDQPSDSEAASDLVDVSNEDATSSSDAHDGTASDGDVDNEIANGADRESTLEQAAGSSGQESGSITGAVVVLGILAVLGGVAWWRTRRSRVEPTP